MAPADANKDGVANGGHDSTSTASTSTAMGRTRGPDVGPENTRWKCGWEKADQGRTPTVIGRLELHNDGSGKLHPASPAMLDANQHLERMETLEMLLRKHTWFTEGSVKPTAATTVMLSDGWLQRFGIDGAVHEFDCNWIRGAARTCHGSPLGKLWQRSRTRLVRVFAVVKQ